MIWCVQVAEVVHTPGRGVNVIMWCVQVAEVVHTPCEVLMSLCGVFRWLKWFTLQAEVLMS